MRVAIYVRVSTLEQAEEGYSIDEQIDKLKKFCEIKNWTVAKIYKDGGFSGAKTDRPALNQMIRDAKRKKFDTVLVYKLDRLSRSQKDTLYLIEDVFDTNNIAFVSLQENFDTSTAFGKAMIGILAVFAQLEREQIRERMMMGKMGRAKSGKPMSWAIVPFGYSYKNGIYLVNHIQATIVKQIFEEYLDGLSITKLIDKLNDEGHVGKDKKWSHKTIRDILDNPIYAGLIRYQERIFSGNHEAIINEEIYYKVQEELKVRQKQAYAQNNNPRPFQAKYMLSGLIRCGICGATFEVELRVPRKDGTRRKVYRCISRSKSKKHARTLKKNPSGCTSPSYEMTGLEQTVLAEIEKLRIDTSILNECLIPSEDENIEVYKEEISKLEKSLEKTVNLYIDDMIPKNILDKKKSSIDQQISSLELKIEDVRPLNPTLSLNEAKKTLDDIKVKVFDLEYDQQKLIVRKLIKNIKVYPDKLKIAWSFVV